MVKFKLWWKVTAKNACQEPAFLNGTKDEGRTDVEDDERSRRPTISKTTNNNREIEKIVREDRRLSIRLIAERMSIDKETMWQVLLENLRMTKVCASLTSDQKEKRQEICADISKQIKENPKFLDSVITVPAMRDEFSGPRDKEELHALENCKLTTK